MEIKRRRSVLYVPGSNAKALAKARRRGADCLILDLEDAVALQAKAAARENIHGFLRDGAQKQTEVIIRINALGSVLAEADLAMVAAAGADAVLVPKVNGAPDMRRAAAAMAAAGVAGQTRLWVMMETPLAMLEAARIAACAGEQSHALAALVIGSNDLYAELRARPTPDRAAITGLLGVCVAAARAHGLDVIDGVYNDFTDARGFAAECRQGADMGMDGKSLIHPAQIGICHEIFSPDAAQIRWAREVIAAFARPENAAKGAISIDGRMAERLHLENAKRILFLAGMQGPEDGKNKL